jgi:hypothetical protein
LAGGSINEIRMSVMIESPDRIVETEARRLAPMIAGMPPVLRDSVARHLRHLSDLVRSMASAGQEPARIRSSLRMLLRLYEADLARALAAVAGRGRDDG